MKLVHNEKGLTLVEILAAVVILSIIFVGIMTIFPQMTHFNAKTEAKLNTMNLARQEVAEIAAAEKWTSFMVPDYLSDTKITEELGKSGYHLKTAHAMYWTFEKQEEYRYEADIFIHCETNSPTLSQCEVTDKIKLYKVHLKVYNGSQMSSETFSYIPYTIESSGE